MRLMTYAGTQGITHQAQESKLARGCRSSRMYGQQVWTIFINYIDYYSGL